MKLTFVGGGNMASALVGAMIAQGGVAADFSIIEPGDAQRARLAARFPGVTLHDRATREAFGGATLVVLAVKPQHMREACGGLAPFVRDVPAVLSIAAGTRCADIARWLGGYDRIVRAMPNTPALVAAGISGVYAPASVGAAGRSAAADVLEAAGEVVWCEDESTLDAITGISGSGPAYVFYFLEHLERAARELGLPAIDAERLAYRTFVGAMRLAEDAVEDAATLRAQVTSKGGTTERAIATLDEAGVGEAFVRAVKAAALRARELGEALGRDEPR
jgi:pyrroline-5-carboxylate reductase